MQTVGSDAENAFLLKFTFFHYVTRVSPPPPQPNMAVIERTGVHNQTDGTPERVCTTRVGGWVTCGFPSARFPFTLASLSVLDCIRAGCGLCSTSLYASHSAWKTSSCSGVKPSRVSYSVIQCDSVPSTYHPMYLQTKDLSGPVRPS